MKQAPDDWTILANLRLTDEKKDWEFDLVVLMPDVGVVVAEVKGGSVTVEDGVLADDDLAERDSRHPSRRPGA